MQFQQKFTNVLLIYNTETDNLLISIIKFRENESVNDNLEIALRYLI